MELKYLIFIILLAIVSVACDGTMPIGKRVSSAQQERVKHYIKTAEHLTEDQRQAMKHGKPFIGMTYEEARMAMTLVDWQGKIDDKILKAQFKNSENNLYVLFFNCGTPNRVRLWSAFTDKEVEELRNFRDAHPCPPITLPYQR